MKPILLHVHWPLYEKIKAYAKERGLGIVGAIRLILSEFFRNNPTAMNNINELPDGIGDMGKGKGLLIDTSKLRDKDGVVHPPPEHLSKEQTIEWVRNFHESQKKET